MATPMALRSGHHLLHGRVGKLRRRSRRDGALQVDIDAEVEVAVAGQPKKRTFRKDSYRGVDLNVLLDMSTNDLSSSYPSVPAEGSEEEADGSIKSLRTMVPIAFYKFNTGMLECVIFAV
ncbi:hypothetical protein BDA96_07G126300 [Sorghum bicolor]|uniref:Uncharacterized protein n=1 Tax=Sorghum bicolor TaxID=4558 RepID=A0A921QKB5_SORBI|nr:hypothetical protein BDA96_07G126300 [Sorghum bicolor]KAG0523473.1 hypothetical protein BDA96_07G126300 [Sorghum bicolor]